MARSKNAGDRLYHAIGAFTKAAKEIDALSYLLDRADVDSYSLSRLRNNHKTASLSKAESLSLFCKTELTSIDAVKLEHCEWHNSNIGMPLYNDIIFGVYDRYPDLMPKIDQPTFAPGFRPCEFDVEVRQDKIVFVSMSFEELSRLEGRETVTIQVDRIFLFVDRGTGRVEGEDLTICNSSGHQYAARRRGVGLQGRWNVGRSDGPLDGVFPFFELCSLEGSDRPGDDAADGVRQGDKFSAQFSVANLDVRSTLQGRIEDGAERSKVFRQFLINREYPLDANDPLLIFDLDLYGSKK